MSAFIGHLAEGEPEERSFWIDAVERALDVMAGARRSYEEYQLRRDPYLRDQLGLTLPELSALAALMIGPRRGNRAEQSLLLALHRDPATPVDLVVGAARRLSVLRARTTVLWWPQLSPLHERYRGLSRPRHGLVTALDDRARLFRAVPMATI